MITIVLKCSFRNYEHRITDTMKQGKCVCLPFSELILSPQNIKIHAFSLAKNTLPLKDEETVWLLFIQTV